MHFFNNNIPLLVTILFFSMCFFFRCANPAAPQGGPVDSLPPKVVSMLPDNFTTHFSAKKIVITFDEYVQLKEPQNNVFISPELKYRPSFSVKGRSVIVDLKELDSMTTYKIDFGLGIVDNNEGNVLRGFSYVFSTGSHIDSLVMSGQVLDAFKRDSILNAVVLLYDANADSLSYDSTIFISRPLSVARTDSMGVFIASNLKDMNYRIYALFDDNNNMRYEKGTERIGFIDSFYNPSKMPPFKVWFNPDRKVVEASPQITFDVFSEIPGRRQVISDIKRINRQRLDILFASRHPRIEKIHLDSIDSSLVIKSHTRYGDTLTLWMDSTAIIPDTLKGYVNYYTVDSIGNDTVVSKKIISFMRDLSKTKKKVEVKKLPVNVKVVNPNITPYDDLLFSFDYPLYEPDISKLSLMVTMPSVESTAGRAPRQGEAVKKEEQEAIPAKFTFVRDSIDILKWRMKSDWIPAAKYSLNILPGAFVNIANETNDSLRSSFEIKNPAKYGIININTSNITDTTKRYIIQIVEGQGRSLKHSISVNKNGKTTIDYVDPREKGYSIRIIEDVNANGVWDEGDVINRVKPEKVIIYTDNDGISSFGIKENWEMEIDIDINKLFR